MDKDVRTRIKKMGRSGMTPRAIAALLDAEGVPAPRGGERWPASTISTVLAMAGISPTGTGLDPATVEFIRSEREKGTTQRETARLLNEKGHRTARGKNWDHTGVSRYSRRLELEAVAA